MRPRHCLTEPPLCPGPAATSLRHFQPSTLLSRPVGRSQTSRETTRFTTPRRGKHRQPRCVECLHGTGRATVVPGSSCGGGRAACAEPREAYIPGRVDGIPAVDTARPLHGGRPLRHGHLCLFARLPEPTLTTR